MAPGIPLEQHCLQPGCLSADDQHPLVRDVHVVRGLAPIRDEDCGHVTRCRAVIGHLGHQLRGLGVGVEGEHLLVILPQTVHHTLVSRQTLSNIACMIALLFTGSLLSMK